MHLPLFWNSSRLLSWKASRRHASCLLHMPPLAAGTSPLIKKLNIWPPFCGTACQRRSATSTEQEFGAEFASLTASSGEALEEVERKNKSLRAILKTLSWPRVTWFFANGIRRNLPWSPTRKLQTPLGLLPASNNLQYLAGFFDGDGCVTCNSSRSACELSVAQSYDNAAVLVQFSEAFGGGIYRNSEGAGLQKPSLKWRILGAAAREAACLLASHSITKKKQLDLAASWPDALSEREASKAQLRSLKVWDSAVARPCTWEYIAGFFDAEGYVRLQSPASLVLEVGQKFVTVLRCLQLFLAEHCCSKPELVSLNNCFRLQVGGTPACKNVLHEMLGAGLLGKAEQAKLAIGLTLENSSDVRASLAKLVGNQMFGKQLDAAGLCRAGRIKVAGATVLRLRRQGKLQMAADKMRDVNDMKRQHKLLKSLHENQCLLEYIRMIQTLDFHEDLRDGTAWQLG